jgi:hypothetical protein
MFHPLDIFKTDPDGSVLCLGAAEDFAAAKAYIENLERSSLGEYLILDQITSREARVTMGICLPAAEAGPNTAPAQSAEASD